MLTTMTKKLFNFALLALPVAIILNGAASFAEDEEEDDDDLVSQELTLDHLSFRYNSVDGSIWESCTVTKLKQTHDFGVTCGQYKFSAHVLFRIWGPSDGQDPDAKTYDLLVMVDRHEDNGSITSATQAVWLEVDKGSSPKKITSDVSFDNGNNILQTRIKF